MAEAYGVTEAEILELKLSHMISKHSTERCPSGNSFKDKDAISLRALMQMQSEDM